MRKRIVFLSSFLMLPLLAVSFFCGCGEQKPKETDSTKLSIYAGLPPVAFLAERIAGDGAKVQAVLPEGRSPHDYSPGPRDIRAIAKSNCFLTTGMEFEKTLEAPLRAGKVKIVDVSEGVRRIPFEGGESCEGHDHETEEPEHTHAHEEHDAHAHAHEGLDPHLWLSPANDVIVAENICRALSEVSPAQAADFRRNCDQLQAELREIDAELHEKLRPYAGRSFYVYHPAFGYFASAGGLKQRSVEFGGKEPSPAHLARIIKEARADQVRVIFVQPQFNPAAGRALAQAIHGQVVGLDPLSHDLIGNWNKMLEALLQSFAAETGAVK